MPEFRKRHFVTICVKYIKDSKGKKKLTNWPILCDGMGILLDKGITRKNRNEYQNLGKYKLILLLVISLS